MTWSELQVTTHFSFLRGASSCEELFATAALMGMPALGITDRNSVAGVVRALVAAEKVTAEGYPVRLVAGCRERAISSSASSSRIAGTSARVALRKITGATRPS